MCVCVCVCFVGVGVVVVVVIIGVFDLLCCVTKCCDVVWLARQCFLFFTASSMA